MRNLKSICLVIGFLWSNFIMAQIINIPDPIFKAKLLEADPNLNSIAGYGMSNNFILTSIDTNDNGEIEVSEAKVITYLSIPTSNISDLTGIEYFTNLIWFGCAQNNISDLSLLQAPNIISLFCQFNQISTLDLSDFSILEVLACSNNQITSLDFSNNPQLRVVYCGNNQLSSLDFSNNPLFNDLGCKNNPNLTTLKIKNGATQLFGSQTIYNECWTGNPNLTNICADANEIPALQTYLANCSISTANININSSCVLENEEFVNQNVVIYPNPVKDSFSVENYSIHNPATLQFYSTLGQLIYETEFVDNPINISHLASATYFVKIISYKNVAHFKVIKE